MVPCSSTRTRSPAVRSCRPSGHSFNSLKPKEQTASHRHTGSVIYQVAKGRGSSVIAGRRFDWEEKDIFALPAWAPHSHANASSTEDAVLFSFNDFPQ